MGEHSFVDQIWLKEFQPRFGNLRAILHGTSLVGDITPKTEAKICSFGEKFACLFMRIALRSLNTRSKIVKAEKIIRTDSNYLEANVYLENSFSACKKVISPILGRGMIPIVAGFVGKDTHGDNTLLGRGGSDYTASILAMALDAEKIEIWTDVNGIMTADPRIVKDAFSWKALDLNIMSEMAYSGIKIVHPKSIELAIQKNIPVTVFNTFNRVFNGTIVNNKKTKGVMGIVSTSNNVLLNLKNPNMLDEIGFIANVTDIVKQQQVSIDVCATSETSFSFSIKDDHDLEKLLKALSDTCKVTIVKDVAKVCIIGNEITQDTNLFSEIFNICAQNRVQIHTISVSASRNNITFMINDSDCQSTVNKLHKKLINDKGK